LDKLSTFCSYVPKKIQKEYLRQVKQIAWKLKAQDVIFFYDFSCLTYYYDVTLRASDIQIGQIAWKLKEQGVITLPALEWDGQLGPEERVAIVRLGFLLNAYQVCLCACVCAYTCE